MYRNDERRGWDVATSCDVRLSRLFKEGGPLEGQWLEIDATAIDSTLQHIDPDATGTVHFHVTDRESGFRTTLGNAERHNSNGEPINSTVRVRLNNASGIADSSRLQKTSVHELSHVVDFCCEDLMKSEETRRKRLPWVFAGTMALAETSTYELGHLAASIFADQDPAKIIGGIIVAGSLFIPNALASRILILNAYLYRNTELNSLIRAADADRRPQIISVKS